METSMLWLKALHIILVTSWFAGLFYLPRLFVNHAMTENPAVAEQLHQMEQRLYRFMTPLGLLALLSGIWLWLGSGLAGGWLHTKLLLAALLAAYHLYCGKLVSDFRHGRSRRSHVWYRWFNEIPVLILAAAVILAVVKPF